MTDQQIQRRVIIDGNGADTPAEQGRRLSNPPVTGLLLHAAPGEEVDENAERADADGSMSRVPAFGTAVCTWSLDVS